MQLQTILNYVEKYKSFVYRHVRWEMRAGQKTLRVDVEPRRNSRPECSGCGKRRAIHDRLRPRTFEHIPLWGIAVFLVYAMRRVNCPNCGVCVESVPWAQGKCRQTRSYRLFLARWARRLSWQETAEIFGTSWDTVYRAVRWVVSWGVVNHDVSGVEAIGIDEIARSKGHRYMTLVYQIDSTRRRLLWVGTDRTEKTLHKFFDQLGDDVVPTLKYVCSDMWKPYLGVIADRAQTAIHILDRYHIMANMNKAIDKIRAAEYRELKGTKKEGILKHARWCLLKRPENRSDKEVAKLSELAKHNGKSFRATLQKEDFQRFWTYASPGWARKFLRDWCTRAMRSKLEPMKEMAASLRRHEDLLINWFRAKGTISAGTVEGLNNKAKVAMRKSYGFRSADILEVVLYHNLADLPEPPWSHKYC